MRLGTRLPAVVVAFLLAPRVAAAATIGPEAWIVMADHASAPAAVQADSVTPPAPRPTLASRARKTAGAFVSDVGYIVSSPFRLKGHGFLWTAGVIGATAVIYGYDGELLEAFHRSRGNGAYDAVLELGERTERLGFMGETGPYWIGGAVLGTAFDVPWLQSLCLDVIESHLITGGIRNSAKTLIGRQRPFESGRASFFKHGTSLPSGHTSVVFEVATILTRHTEGAPLAVRIPIGVVAYGVATGVAVQRVDSRGHWPSDVFLGGASGALIANTVARRNKERRAKEGGQDHRGAAVTPWLDETGVPRGVLIAIRF